VYLTTEELHKAEVHWYLNAQLTHFSEDVDAIKSKSDLDRSSPLLSLRPSLGTRPLEKSERVWEIGWGENVYHAPGMQACF